MGKGQKRPRKGFFQQGKAKNIVLTAAKRKIIVQVVKRTLPLLITSVTVNVHHLRIVPENTETGPLGIYLVSGLTTLVGEKNDIF